MRLLSLVALPLAALCSLLSVTARSATGDRVLVVLEPSVSKGDYSKLWASLQARGFDLTFKAPLDQSAELIKFGEKQYDHLVLYTPSTKAYSSALSSRAILDAQLAGLNTLYLLDSTLSEHNRESLREYDLEFIETSQTLLDAFSFPSTASASSPLLYPAGCAVAHGAVLSSETLTGGPIVYPSGTVHALGLNPYLFDVLHGSKTSFVGADKAASADEAEVEATTGSKVSKDAVISGKKAGLVSAMQTTDNVRIGFVGSGAMFSDKWWDATVAAQDGKQHKTGNAKFAADFTKWVFQETGVVKVVSSTHHREGEVTSQDLYYKRDNVVYSITLAKYYTTPNGTAAWGPFYIDDVQLDFTMLDPHYRTALVRDESISPAVGTAYTAKFLAPDRHGVFKFNVQWFRPGWTYLRETTKVSVAPLRHDQHPRFVVGAWPFYLSTISISVAFLLFCSLWVALGESDRDRKGKKKAE